MRLSHQTFILAGIGIVGLWMTGSLVQELALNQSLNQQAASVRAQNAGLRTTNAEYAKDITAVTSGAAAEEEARKDGYARSDEKVYLISTPAPPTPAPAAKRKQESPGGLLDVLRRIFG